MKTFKLVSLLVLVIVLTVVVVQNTASVQVNFLWLSGSMPAVLLLLLTTLGGFVLGLLVALLAGSRSRSQS